MSKPQWSFMIIAMMSLASTLTFGQVFSFQSNKTATTTNKIEPPMSADEFKAAVTKKDQQTQEELYQQTQSNLKQQALHMPLPTPPPPTTPKSTVPTATSPAPGKPTAPTTTPPPAEAVSTIPDVPASTPSSAEPKASSAPSSAAQEQIYTGFGNNSDTSNTQSTSPTNGGWNIKY